MKTKKMTREHLKYFIFHFQEKKTMEWWVGLYNSRKMLNVPIIFTSDVFLQYEILPLITYKY